MPDFSVILQTPEVRALVQEGLLERAFHDALFPYLLFRGEATPVPWPTGIGDSQIFSAPGLITPDAAPLVPGTDPEVTTYPSEQWEAQLNQYAKSIDTHMPTSITAIANLFLRNAHQLGLQASQTVNRIVRNRMYAAGLSGNTVADGVQGPVTVLRVKRLNGLTRARNPILTGASKVRFDTVSATNPLSVRIFDTTGPAEVTRNIIGFTPDDPGDEFGPGTITLDASVGVLDRAYVLSGDKTSIVRVGGGLKVDDLTPGTDTPTLADIRTLIADFRQQNVPTHPDGRFHAHMDPISESLVFSDPEFNRLLTALPDYYMYKDFSLGELLGVVFFRNSECPVAETVVGGATATFDKRDPFVGELTTDGAAGGPKVHRFLFTAQGGIYEYYQDMEALITEAGITGAVGDPRIVNNGIEVFSERIQLIIRGPLNRLQDQVATSWKIIADWPVRTDASTGSAERFKRFKVLEHAE